MKKLWLLLALVGIVLAGKASAIGTIVSGEITSNVRWTKAGMPYSLSGAVYVRPGASLTVDPGVIVATYKVGPELREGTLIVSRGGDLFINGTATEPVIFTSAEDVATWDGSDVTRSGVAAAGYPNGYVTMINTLGDSTTGTWRPVCLEWGSIAICGEGYMSSSDYKNAPRTWDFINDLGVVETHTNTKCPNGLNRAQMEGTTLAYPGDIRVLYGGDNDNDDSGSIKYLSIRYGGKIIVNTDELNGLSLGGVGRGTDISYVEIMNNVDDGIEIWGGTVNIDHVSIWNIGDDSLDCDQGWRGSAQYGLIVQGWSNIPPDSSKAQGSGVGDNCFEIDGAEDADAQPVTTAKISNFTVIGQPGTSNRAGGDGGTAWRDNARVQYDKCVWMDLDDQLVLFDDNDTDGANGYDGDGNNSTKLTSNNPVDGTLSWDEHWTTSYNQWKVSDANDPQNCGINFATLYEQYVSTDLDGALCQITNSVIKNDAATNASCFTEYNRINGLVAGGNPALAGNVQTSNMPIQALVRAPANAVTATLTMLEVKHVNPCAANEAAAMGAGGFSPCYNWLGGWAASAALVYPGETVKMTDTSMNAVSSDFNCDGMVNIADFTTFSNDWLK